MISIIIPTYNEGKTIEKLIDNLNKNIDIDEYEIIIVDDFSNDNTEEILNNCKSKYKNISQIIKNKKNFGKGYSIKRGIEISKGDIILFQDADLEYDPSDIKNLIEPILRKKADIVYGSRFTGSSPKRAIYFWNYVANKFLTVLCNMFANLNITDMETGYKCFTANSIKSINIEEPRFGMEPEITIKLAKKKFKFYEIGISYNGRTYEEGKKVSFKDGVRAIYCIIKYSIKS